MVFSLFCVFCIFAQGFSVKAQRFDQKSKFLTSFITFLDLKMLKTFVLDTFAGENTVKPMYFQFFVGREARGRRGVDKKCNKTNGFLTFSVFLHFSVDDFNEKRMFFTFSMIPIFCCTYSIKYKHTLEAHVHK